MDKTKEFTLLIILTFVIVIVIFGILWYVYPCEFTKALFITTILNAIFWSVINKTSNGSNNV